MVVSQCVREIFQNNCKVNRLAQRVWPQYMLVYEQCQYGPSNSNLRVSTPSKLARLSKSTGVHTNQRNSVVIF